MSRMLEIERLTVRYGHITAVEDVDLHLSEGEIVTVLGANGAGKSSLLNALQGLVAPRTGRIKLSGRDITVSPPPRRVADGLALVPEGRRILISMTVHENLQMGGYARSGGASAADIDAIYERFPNLAARRHMSASVLSGGEQQMLAIGRAMLARPKVMMLDEPSLGLSPKLIAQLFTLLSDLNHQEGIALLLVEQNTRKALEIAGRAYVLELGRVVMQGAPADLLSDERLRDAYLGTSHSNGAGSAGRTGAAPVRSELADDRGC